MNISSHYLGHRQRLREKLEKFGPESLATYEMLELFLFLVLPRGDTKPLAKNLLDRFKSIEALIEADEKLILEVTGVGPAVVSALKVYRGMMRHQFKNKILKKSVLQNWEQVLEYCHTTMAYSMREEFRLLFLDKKIN